MQNEYSYQRKGCTVGIENVLISQNNSFKENNETNNEILPSNHYREIVGALNQQEGLKVENNGQKKPALNSQTTRDTLNPITGVNLNPNGVQTNQSQNCIQKLINGKYITSIIRFL